MAQKCHGNFNFTMAISTLLPAISTSSRQFQLRSRQFQFHHGNFNFITAISTSLTAISTLLTAISILSQQFQFRHGNFNLVIAISKSSSLASLSLSLKVPYPIPGSLWPFKMNDMAENLKYKFQSLRIICLPQNAKHSRT